MLKLAEVYSGHLLDPTQPYLRTKLTMAYTAMEKAGALWLDTAFVRGM